MPPDREMLDRVATKSFELLADCWRLTPAERRRWLGCDLCPQPSPEDRLDRLSYALGIYQDLHQIFPEASVADGWMQRHNAYFGCSALDYALDGGPTAMRDIREHLNAQLLQ